MRKFPSLRLRNLLTLFAGTALAFLIMAASHAHAQTGALLHANTLANNTKSNQNKIWFHDNKWWTIAPDLSKNADYIWRYDGGGVWTRTSAKLEKGAFNRYDVFMDSNIGELSIVRSHTTYAKFYRYTYSAGAWSLAVATPLFNFGNPDNNNPCSLTKAKNGEFWIFRVDTTLEARRSADGGVTWQPKFTIKSGLNAVKGTTDAITFTKAGNNFIGVAYGELNAAGVNTQFGFLFHRDTATPTTWVDETSLITYAGTEKGHNSLSLAAGKNGDVFMFTRNAVGGNAHPRNTLYKRTGISTWQRHAVNLVGDTFKWNSPTVAIDSSSNTLIVAGVRADSGFAEYKSVVLGSEATLSTAPRGLLLQNGMAVLDDLNFPRQLVNSVDGLMVTAANVTQNKAWFNLFFKNPAVPILVDTVKVLRKEVNAKARYRIPITLTDPANGVLTGGVGTISIRFSPTAIMPASIAPGLVKLNGVAAAAVTTTPLTKEMIITTANTIAGNAAVMIVIDSLASVVNKQKPGLDSLQVWTSAQLLPVYSPAFILIKAKTKVAAASVTPEPKLPGLPASYRIGFRVGNQGRMSAGQDTFRLAFNAQTKVMNGALSGVLVNSLVANATADSIKRKIQIQLPAGAVVANGDTVTLDLPSHILSNPALAGFYSMLVATSVETSQVVSKLYEIGGVDTCGTPIPGTTGTFARGNQSKSFYHGGSWWMIAQAQADNDWYLWKFASLGWIQDLKISEFAKDRPDAWLEGASDKAYVLLPGTTTTKLLLLNYSGGVWTIASGFPKSVNGAQNDEMNLARASNGDLWVFWAADSSVWAQRSANEGASWFPAVAIKKMHVFDALTDAVRLSIGGASIGLAFAENSSSPLSRYGFLYHKDGAADSVWTDESETKLGPIHPGGTSADNHVHLMTISNQIFMTIKTKGGSGATTTKNALFHRTSGAGGTWTRYDIIQGNGWTRPLAALDVTNNVFYVFGIREGAIKNIEMKQAAFGDYGSLLSAPVDTVLCNVPDDFFDITMPMHTVTSATSLMLVAENESQNQLWFKLLTLASLPKHVAPAAEEVTAAGQIEKYELAASVYPNPFNPRTAIKFTLPQPAQVKLQIFNLSGQLMRTLVNDELPPGAHQRRWNARDEHGRRVASGTYLYRLQVGPNVLTGNMQLLK